MPLFGFMTDVKSIEFLAAFPDIQTAIKVTGGGNGMRIQLDIPEDQMAQALYLMTMRQQILKVTVEVADSDNQQQPKPRQSTY